MSVSKVTSENFSKEVLESEIPVLIDFYADWCGPCKMMSPIIESVADKLSSKIKVVKINVDEENELAIKYEISNIPTLVLIKDGQVIRNLVGMRDQNELEEFIENSI